VGRGTPAISGGAAFFPFEDFTPDKGQMYPRMHYIQMVLGSSPM